MKIRITKTPIPQMAHGGPFGYNPYSGSPGYANPFGNINSQTMTDEENINASVKPVDEEDANLEAEKGEVLFKFDMGGIFDIKGKRHSQGGTPLKADPGDFIISRDKSLAITKEEKEVFEFKLGGSYKKSKSTPADVLKKEVDLKHYNQLITILKDPLSDNIAKKTAELMLGKYQEKIGQVAYLQEAKKGFPNGLPDFSMGTAPVKTEDGSEAEPKEKMYAQYGAQFKGDQLPPMNIPPYNKLPKGYGDPAMLQQVNQSLVPFGYAGDMNDPNAMQQFQNEFAPDAAPFMYQNGFLSLNNKQYDPKRDPNAYTPDYYRQQFNDGRWGQDAWTYQRKDFNSQKEYDDYIKTSKFVGNTKQGEPYYWNNQSQNGQRIPRFDIAKFTPQQVNNETIPQTPGSKPTVTPNTVADFKANPINPTSGGNPYNPIEWNAQERLTTAMPFLSALATPVQNPMLQQIYTPGIRLDRVSNEQELRDIRQQAALAQRELGQNTTGKNAYLASAPVRAQMIDQIGRSNAQNNNVNTQISNSEDMNNYQQAINDRNFNTQAVGQYYDKTQLVRGRRNQELRNALAQSLNNGVMVQDKLDALNQNLFQTNAVSLDAQGNPRFILDPKTRTPKLNPDWKGDVTNNPFIGTGQDNTKMSSFLNKIIADAMNSNDPETQKRGLAAMNIAFKYDNRKK